MIYNNKLLSDLKIIERKLSSKEEEIPKEIKNMISLCEREECSSAEFKEVADACYKKILELINGGYLYFPNPVQRSHFLGLFQNHTKAAFRCKIISEDYNRCLPSENLRAHFVNKYSAVKVGVANAKQRGAGETIVPIFVTDNFGYYYAISIDKEVYAVVPVFGVSIDPLLYGAHAMSYVFNLGVKNGPVYSVEGVDGCALFGFNENKWSFVEKGKLSLKLGKSTSRSLSPVIPKKSSGRTQQPIASTQPIKNSIYSRYKENTGMILGRGYEVFGSGSIFRIIPDLRKKGLVTANTDDVVRARLIGNPDNSKIGKEFIMGGGKDPDYERRLLLYRVGRHFGSTIAVSDGYSCYGNKIKIIPNAFRDINFDDYKLMYSGVVITPEQWKSLDVPAFNIKELEDEGFLNIIGRNKAVESRFDMNKFNSNPIWKTLVGQDVLSEYINAKLELQKSEDFMKVFVEIISKMEDSSVLMVPFYFGTSSYLNSISLTIGLGSMSSAAVIGIQPPESNQS